MACRSGAGKGGARFLPRGLPPSITVFSLWSGESALAYPPGPCYGTAMALWRPFQDSPSMRLNGTARFCTTQWTVILGVSGPVQERKTALEQFCRMYWYPIYAFIRRRGTPVEDARDLTQEFFAQMLEKDWLEGVERRDTRFSTLLLTVLKRFLATVHRDATTLKRGGGAQVLSLDVALAEEWLGAEPSTGETPENTFERRWALAVMDAALAALRTQAANAGKGRHFEALVLFLSREPESGEYESLEPVLGMKPGAVAVAVHRLRQQYREALRSELGAGELPSSRVDEELRHLSVALRE